MKRTATLALLLTFSLLMTSGCEWNNIFSRNGNNDVEATTLDADTDIAPEDETNEQTTIRQQRNLIDTQKARIAELENDNITLANELIHLQQQVEDLELANSNKGDMIDAVSAAVDERNQLEGEVAILEQDLLELRAELADAQAWIAELERQLTATPAELLEDAPAPDAPAEDTIDVELEPAS